MSYRSRLQWGAAVIACGLLVSAPRAGDADKTAAAFEHFRALAGEWVAAEDGEMVKKGELVARYRLTGSGSAVVEDIFPGTPHEMTTVYHRDGADLVLTHYCMSGNQPRMRAKPTGGPRLAFEFDGGTNIDPGRDQHMHRATFEFVGADELRSEWTEYAEGKSSMTVKMHLVRKSS